MSVQLNHTIVSCRDQQRSAAFLTGILGLPPATRFGHFLVVEADNGVSLDFAETSGAITAQHYAFLVGEEEFDAAFGRIRQQDLPYWADPGRRQAGVINTRDGGRGVYFEDPDGHLLELLTRPYGSGGSLVRRRRRQLARTVTVAAAARRGASGGSRPPRRPGRRRTCRHTCGERVAPGRAPDPGGGSRWQATASGSRRRAAAAGPAATGATERS